jgi:hypothetical protein
MMIILANFGGKSLLEQDMTEEGRGWKGQGGNPTTRGGFSLTYFWVIGGPKAPRL